MKSANSNTALFRSNLLYQVLYRTDYIGTLLQKKIDEARKELRHLYGVEEFKKALIKIIDSLIIPNRKNYEECFHWYTLFLPIKQKLDEISASTHAEWFSIIHGEGQYTHEEIDKIRSRYDTFTTLSGIIDSFDLAQDKYLKHLNTNVLLIEGRVGCGKSHLLGYEAESHGNSNFSRSVLLLGHKFVLNLQPQSQIMTELGLSIITFHEFLEACEAKGAVDGRITVIMIDALNECTEQKVWRTYFNDILNEVKNYKYIRFVCSIRSTYKEIFFNENLLKEISDGEIPLVQLDGFQKILVNAVTAFFHYYKIPITTAAFFNTEFENPLFLRTYCEAYNGEEGIGSRGIFALYKSYINKEERKIKEQLNITDGLHYADKIMEIIGKYLYTKNDRSIPYIELVKLAREELIEKDVIDAFLKAQIIVDYYFGTERKVFINYELYKDFIISIYMINSVSSFDELKQMVPHKYLILDQYGFLQYHEAIGYFATLSVLAREKFDREIIDFINILPEMDNHGFYTYSDLVSEYITAYHWRANANIHADDYFHIVYPYIKSKRCFDKHLENMLSLAGRKCSLNSYALTRWLESMSLAQRDADWTIYINDHYYEGEQIYNTVQYFLTEKIDELTSEERLIYGQELCWFLTASNRPLRDECSRALVRVLRNDLCAITELLKIFMDVNDPYIISRFFGCAYGAILLSTQRFDQKDVSLLTNFIYENIFHGDFVYPDILLRDYARNSLEYFYSKGYELNFSIQSCRPPYRSPEIPDISVETINQEYVRRDGEWLGTQAIKTSLLPNYEIEGLCGTGWYGDFGRYVFQSNLANFKGVDVAQVFKYAFDYIITVLGYDNELFSDFDNRVGYGRARRTATERIGKKYEWIAMYHILALVADHYPYEEIYSDIEIHTYEGEWQNGLRDFEPTLTIAKSVRQFDIGITLHREQYSEWDFTNKNWADVCGKECSFTNLIRLEDSNKESWIALYFSTTDESGKDHYKPRQSIWRSSTACLIRCSERENFIMKLKDKSFYGRWFYAIEVGNSGNVFSREFTWAPSYEKIYRKDGFVDAQIEASKKIVTRKVSVPKKSIKELLGERTTEADGIFRLSIEFEEVDMESEKPIYESIGSILPCYYSYSWEDGVDGSVEDSISYNIPHKFLIDRLKMVQIMDGVWAIGGEITCADFSLIKNSNLEGLYIKRSALEKILSEGYAVVWIGLGEKDFSDGSQIYDRKHYRRSNLSSLIYEDDDGNLIEIKHSDQATRKA